RGGPGMTSAWLGDPFDMKSSFSVVLALCFSSVAVAAVVDCKVRRTATLFIVKAPVTPEALEVAVEAVSAGLRAFAFDNHTLTLSAAANGTKMEAEVLELRAPLSVPGMSPVPETSAALLGGIGVLALLRRFRRA